MPPSSGDQNRITYFATTHTRGKREMFGIRAIDRLKHMYVIGKTGVGKSTMLENMAIQDIQNGEGLIYIDPHGSSAEKLLDFIPQDRIKDVVYFAPFDMEHPIAFNIMEDIGFDFRHNVVANLMGVFERLWADAWSARMSYILQNTLLALLEYPNSTLIDVNRMLVNKAFRNEVVSKVTDPIVKSFWVDEFANFTDTYTREATPAIQNKIGQLVSNPLMRNIISQPKSSIDIRKIMDEKKIFIANLSKGRMGDANSTMIGAVLVIRAYIAAMSRASEPTRKFPPCYFYVDEFQNVVNKAFANILSEARKYGLALTLANQYIAQMHEKDNTSVKDAVFGNVGTTIVFKVGPLDAQELEPLFDPTFTIEDMVGLGVGQIYLTLSIDGITSRPFSAETIPPIEAPTPSYKDDVIAYSRAQYGNSRKEVEQFISIRQNEFPVDPPKSKSKGEGFKPFPSKNFPQEGREPRSSIPPRTGSAAAPRSDERPQPTRPMPPRPKEVEQRNALKDAIAAARGSSEPVKSPADVLREKNKSHTSAHHNPPQPLQQKPPVQSKPAQPAPRPQQAEAAPKNGASGEVSPDVLSQILRGGPNATQ